MQKNRILFVASFPPPVHGSAMVSQFIKVSQMINESFDCDYVNLSTSRRIDEIGKKAVAKVWRLITALLIVLWNLLTRRYRICYLAITCHGMGFLKDLPFVLMCKLFCGNVVIHQHNKGMASYVDIWPYKWLLPMAYKNVKVILLSWRLYPDIERLVSRENVCICPNGTPVVEYTYNVKRNEVPRLLFLSNLIESKGVIVLLDALKILKEKGMSFDCYFVGDETVKLNRVQFGQEVDTRGLNRIVSYKGRKLGLDKRDIFRTADIFVFPTFYHDECFPLVLLEAMQYGLPIVTTSEGGIPDMVENGVNGLICEKNNPESLAMCLELLLNDEPLRKRMGESGYEKYRNEYTLESFEKRLTGILKSCCRESI